MTNTQQKYRAIKKKRKRMEYALGIALALLVVIYLGGYFFYKNHFYQGTKINGVNCSNRAADSAESYMKEKVNTYRLLLEERKDRKEEMRGKDIDLKLTFDKDLSDVLKEQSPSTWFVQIFKEHDLENNESLTFNEDKLKKLVENLTCFDEANIEEPVNATISTYDSEKGFTVVKEKEGTKVDEEALLKAAKNAIMNVEPTLNLAKKDCYVKPEITSDSDTLKNALKTANLYASTKLTYQFGDVTEVLDGSKIGNWISIDQAGNVILDEAQVSEFVAYIRKTYNSFGRVRTIKTSYGQTIQLKGGDYGWWLNSAKEKEEVIAAIKAGEQKEKKPCYIQTAVQYGDDDIGSTYIEINLTAQHMFFYKDGQLVLDSDIVSGCVAKKHETNTGTYPIQYTQRDTTLSGQGYDQDVKYFMPFNGDIGLHDAGWKKQFGGSVYKHNGSHGCINLPPAVAERLFGYVHRGVPVIVYQLPGTESNKTTSASAYK